MIRFINLSEQINDDERAFAFFDTVTSKFKEFDGQQTFCDKQDFEDYFSSDKNPDKGELERYLNLIPEEFN